MAKPRFDMDRSVAFTILLEVMPGFAFPPPRGLYRGSLGPQFPTLPAP